MSELQRWETRYSAPGYTFGKEPNAFLKSQAHRLPRRGAVFSIADGEGRNGVWLAEQGLDVSTVDFSPTGVEKARALAAERGVTLNIQRADITTWQWPSEAFDVVVGIFFQFLTPAERERVFAGIKRALKPGGLLLLEGYGPEQLKYRTGGPQNPEQLYTRALLETAFGDMAEIDIREYDAEIKEGTSHIGMSALIDLVARK